jgi:hypothetical protein
VVVEVEVEVKVEVEVEVKVDAEVKVKADVVVVWPLILNFHLNLPRSGCAKRPGGSRGSAQSKIEFRAKREA